MVLAIIMLPILICIYGTLVFCGGPSRPECFALLVVGLLGMCLILALVVMGLRLFCIIRRLGM